MVCSGSPRRCSIPSRSSSATSSTPTTRNDCRTRPTAKPAPGRSGVQRTRILLRHLFPAAAPEYFVRILCAGERGVAYAGAVRPRRHRGRRGAGGGGNNAAAGGAFISLMTAPHPARRLASVLLLGAFIIHVLQPRPSTLTATILVCSRASSPRMQIGNVHAAGSRTAAYWVCGFSC